MTQRMETRVLTPSFREMTMSALRGRVARHSLVYTIAEFVNKGIPFLVLPITTRYLTTTEFGQLALFLVSVNVLSIVIGLSVHGAVNVNYFHLDRNSLARYVGNVCYILLVTAFLSVLGVLAVSAWLPQALLLPREWLLVAVVIAGSQSFSLVNLVLWQAEQKPQWYGAYQISQTAITFTLTLWFVIRLGWGWKGQATAMLISSVLFAILSVVILFLRGLIQWDFSSRDVQDALRFGVPLVPHMLGAWLLTGLDRFYLAKIIGPSATGLYAVGYQFGLIVGLLAAAFNRAWMPYLYERMKNIDELGKRKLVMIIYAGFGAMLLLALAVTLFSPLVMYFYVGYAFSGSVQFVFWIALAYAFDGMYIMVVNQIFYMKKTAWLAVISFAVGCFHAAISYFGICFFGAIGAAYAMAASFFLYFILVWLMSSRVYPLPWRFWTKDLAEKGV